MLHIDEQRITNEQTPTRGFQSSVDYILTFGLGDRPRIDSLSVSWPDGSREVRRNVPINQRLILRQNDAITRSRPPVEPKTEHLFQDITDGTGISFVHQENDFVDFNRESLLPRMLSTEGPAAAVGDVNGDGRDDFFIGGAKEFAGRLHIQTAGGQFRTLSDAVFDTDALYEDVAAVFFDADGDGDADLYVASGGSEWTELATGMQDRLYINDGSGRMRRAKDALPKILESSSTVQPSDFDKDGDIDLFVGGRLIPWKYGLSATSRLYENNGNGSFVDVTKTLAPDLVDLGMVTDAVWADYDSDRDDDLIVVGDWMAIQVFTNDGGSFSRTDAGLGESEGWWTRIVADDLDGDGDTDFVVGNFGENNRFNATSETPVTMHVSDFDRNGWLEHILSFYRGDRSYPVALRKQLSNRIGFLKQKYTDFSSYAEQSVEDIFTEEQLEGAVVRKANTLATSMLVNAGDGTFRVEKLPLEAQFSPVFGILIDDFDQDNQKDILLAGNFFGFIPQFGRMDANFGLLLKGTENGTFDAVQSRHSGFFVPGETRSLHTIVIGDKRSVFVAKNGEQPQFFRFR